MTNYLIASLLGLISFSAWSQDTCKHRGNLDPIYCDDDRDLVADPPKDANRFRNPPSLLLSYSPQEDTSTYEKLWAPYVEHMTQCSGRKVRFFQVHSSAAAVEAFRSGRLQFSMLATGDTPFAVNIAGAVPYAGIGGNQGLLGYHLVVLVKNDSPYKKLADLAGKRVAHTAPSSNSGNMAPRALFPVEGLTPDKDYKVIYSGKHDNSVTGVLRGDYDAAAVADDVLERMFNRGIIKAGQYRIIYKSKPFPSGSMVMAHDLQPALAKVIRDCTLSFRFSPELIQAFKGSDRYLPMNYRKDFEAVREVAAKSGEAVTRRAEQTGERKPDGAGKK